MIRMPETEDSLQLKLNQTITKVCADFIEERTANGLGENAGAALLACLVTHSCVAAYTSICCDHIDKTITAEEIAEISNEAMHLLTQALVDSAFALRARLDTQVEM